MTHFFALGENQRIDSIVSANVVGKAIHKEHELRHIHCVEQPLDSKSSLSALNEHGKLPDQDVSVVSAIDLGPKFLLVHGKKKCFQAVERL